MTELAGRVVLGLAGFSLVARDRSADLTTIREGIAAGAAILNAELMHSEGMLQ